MATVPSELSQYAVKGQSVPDELSQYAVRPSDSGPAQGGASIAPVSRMTNPKLNIAASGENMPEYVGAVGALGAGAMAAAPAAGPAARFAAQQYLKHPVLGPMIASQVISKLREIPGVGHYIPSQAEWLPLLFGRGAAGKLAGEEAEEVAAAGAKPSAAPEPSPVGTEPVLPRSVASSSQSAIPTTATQGSQTALSASQPPKITPATVERQLEESLGGKPLQKNVPLRAQVPPSKLSDLTTVGSTPQGFTAVNSSVLKAYKYNPAEQEMETITNGGGHYIYGDVSADQAQALASAESKGQAWNSIRSQSPLVAKVLNGKRVAIKPVSPSSSEDLTPTLQKSLQQALAKKGQTPPSTDVPAGAWKMPSAADDLKLAVQQAQKAGTNKNYFVNQLTRYMYPSNAAKVTPDMASKAWDAELKNH